MRGSPVLRSGAARLGRVGSRVRVAREDRAAVRRLRDARTPRVLVVDVLVPSHDRNGGGLRMTWILRLLRSLGYDVTLFPLQQREPREPYTTNLRRLGIEVDHSPRSLGEFAAARAGLYDLVVLSGPGAAGPAIDMSRRAFPAATIIYDSVDLHFLRVARGTEVAGGPAHEEYWREKEVDAFRRSDLVATVTATEADVVRSLVPPARTVLLPTVHEPDPEPRLPFEATHDLLFIGGFLHDPNIDAIRWFVQEIFPLVRRGTDVRLIVIGADPPDEIRALASPTVVVTGYVPEVGKYFREARVFVSPLRYGAGMKAKNGQSMAFGLPLVTTTIGAEGMGLVDGHHALVRDDAEAFASAVVTLYRDGELWRRLSAHSQALVRERWSPDAMRERLGALVTTTAPSANRRCASPT